MIKEQSKTQGVTTVLTPPKEDPVRKAVIKQKHDEEFSVIQQ